jgi:hypothetical protein
VETSHPVAGGQPFFAFTDSAPKNLVIKMLEISAKIFNNYSMIFKSTRLSLSLLLPFLFLGHFSCTEKEIPVSLSIELIDKGITMTYSKANDGVVEIYLISENEAEGELLVKALNASGLEIARAKAIMSLQKDDAKQFTFNFDKGLDLDSVSKYQVALRKK